MKHNPIIVMLEEHNVICATEDIINDLKKMWKTDNLRYKETVRELLFFFREYVDGYHHRKEEQVLFPAINDCPDFVLQEIIEEFETHHEDFRDSSDLIEKALNEGDYEKSYSELYDYLQKLLDHIGAENDELFVLAETLLNDEQLETVFFKFKDIDLEIGEDRKMDLENWVLSH